MVEADYLSPTKLRHFKMIDEYNLLMSMPNAEQKTVFNTLLSRYNDYYKSFDSVKQTFARLKKNHPERFTQKDFAAGLQ
ncbi:hypothetical protein SAMN05443429_11265 [Cruoricaptor ignavus]|uniref:Uncharacterized protein n=1 Tax=Cruoricaptor ignavus TaxID=1118202 RepID=A0A1M6HHP0_9FLAO|nr:hypothetical protein [Cruoricaptor ignavus]SHJ21704.1 hypothetical protein SAMN05443429_11265 [Cruoricaptor ignavus]